MAGDQLKSASDLGVPVVGVGLLYQQGYFRQVLDAQGAQMAFYPYNDPGQLPVTPVRGQDGEWVRLEIMLPGYKAWIRAWQVQVGRAKLYLLERARSFMEDNGVPFNVALTVTCASNLFTTHTPVEAGFDRFTSALIEQFLGRYAQNALGISL